MKQEWSNVAGCAVITFDDEPPTILEPFGAKVGDQLLISFLSSGYYMPASMYGGSDHMGWPAEGDDERKIVGVVLHTVLGNREVEIPKELFDKLYEEFETDIYKEEMDHEPDYD
jgi:hypothetical protein